MRGACAVDCESVGAASAADASSRDVSQTAPASGRLADCRREKGTPPVLGRRCWRGQGWQGLPVRVVARDRVERAIFVQLHRFNTGIGPGDRQRLAGAVVKHREVDFLELVALEMGNVADVLPIDPDIHVRPVLVGEIDELNASEHVGHLGPGLGFVDARGLLGVAPLPGIGFQLSAGLAQLRIGVLEERRAISAPAQRAAADQDNTG